MFLTFKVWICLNLPGLASCFLALKKIYSQRKWSEKGIDIYIIIIIIMHNP